MGVSTSVPLELKQPTALVNEAVGSNCVVIFSKTTCSYCRMAKRVFDELEHPYKTIELNETQDGAAIQRALTAMTGLTTVPNVFVNGKSIGGGSETCKLHKEGKLVVLLQSCR